MSDPLPSLSVVMPTRNQAPFIADSVASVMAQGIEGLELVVQDGASTDGTPTVLADLAARHTTLRWASEPDSGPAEAVNRAVERARAPVIGWLNSDDLYTTGAPARALALFASRPDLVMVYGEGEHVDEQGAPLGRYPTLGPEAPLTTWRDGCPICQPTAFFRRDAFIAMGGLDTSLRAAFDFDFWLKMFRAYPGRIAHLPQMQAQSRLHASAITLRLRETVALEGLQVVHRHFGSAPAHWMLTCIEESLAGFPLDGGAETPTVHLLKLAERAAPWLGASGLATVRTRITSHRAIRVGNAWLFAPVSLDGWATESLALRVVQPGRPFTVVRLLGRHAGPRGWSLRLRASRPGQEDQWLEVPRPGAFSWTLPLNDLAASTRGVWTLECSNPFEPGRGDTRRLSFLLEGLEGLPA